MEELKRIIRKHLEGINCQFDENGNMQWIDDMDIMDSLIDAVYEATYYGIHGYSSHVSDMREAQKKYFDTRDPYWLKLSKQREKQVDELTKAILEPDTQQKLF